MTKIEAPLDHMPSPYRSVCCDINDRTRIVRYEGTNWTVCDNPRHDAWVVAEVPK